MDYRPPSSSSSGAPRTLRREVNFGDAPRNYVAGRGRGAHGFMTRTDIGPAASAPTVGVARSSHPAPASNMGARGREVASGIGPAAPPRLSSTRTPGKVMSFGVAPVNYVAGAGRGSGGFGETKPKPVNVSDLGDMKDYSDTQFDPNFGYRNAKPPSTAGYDDDDKEADAIYSAVDEHMDGRRKRRREEKLKKSMEELRKTKPRIADQFADLKKELAVVTAAEWDAVPEIGDTSVKHRKKERFTPITDSIIDAARSSSKIVNSVSSGDGTMTDMRGMSAAKDRMLQVKLNAMSDSVSGQTVVDPKGYLTSLSSVKVTSASEIGDIKKARLLLKSVTSTNPKHGPGWIAAARLEEVAGKLIKARTIMARACKQCPKNEDVWLEAARLNTPANAKVILAEAVRRIPGSVNVWIRAAELEGGSGGDAHEMRLRKRRVLRKALERIPNSVKIWMAAIELEDPSDAVVMLSRAVECVPQSVEMWLALARLETYKNAQKVLNKARATIPGSPKIWIAACQLEESQGNSAVADKIMRKAVKALSNAKVVVDRNAWMKEADIAEEAGSPVTCAAIVRATVGMGVAEADLKRTWMDDAAAAEERSCFAVARAIYSHAISNGLGEKKGVWLRWCAFERRRGDANKVRGLLVRAIEACPHSEILWLMAAKETWVAGDVPGARSILKQAFEAGHDSEAVWLAAAKLEWESDEIKRARALLNKARARAETPRVWMKSCLLEREAGNHKEEERLLKLAQTKFPSFDKLWMMMGQAAARRDAVGEAREAYRDGLRHCPESVTLWILASRLEESNVGPVKARTILNKARVQNPASDNVWLESIKVEERAGEASHAKSLLSMAMKACPNSGLLWAHQVSSATRAQKKSVSIAALKKCDRDARVILAVAVVFLKERKISKARKWLNRAVALDDDFGDAWAALYRLELDHGTAENVTSVIERCVAADPKHGELWCTANKSNTHRGKGVAEVLEAVVEHFA